MHSFINDHLINLSIVGNGPERDVLKVLSKELKIKNILFYGQQNPKKVQELIRRNNCLVLPSLSEGSPNVIKEAMACGLPVIATKVGGIPEIIEHGVHGLLFEPRDEYSLAEHLIFLINNPKKSIMMGNAGRKFIIDNNLNWDNTAKKYIQLYKSILRS